MIIQSATADPDFLNTPHLVGFRDDFESSGNFNVRTGWTVETRTGFDSQSSAITAGSGAAGGTTGTAAYAWHQATDEAARVTTVIGSAITQTSGTGGTISDHVSLATGTPSMFQFNHIWLTSGGVSTGRVTLTHLKNTTTGTTIVQFTNLRFERGDSFTRQWTSAGVVTPYLNGRQCWPSVDCSTHVGSIGTGVPLNGKFGLIGGAGAETWLDFWESSENQGWLNAYMPNRIVRINANGGGDWYVPISYNGVIGRVDYQVHNAADDTVRVAWTQATIASDVIQFSTNSTQTPTAGTHYVVMRRHLGNGNYAYARGPVQTIGYVVLQSGQSLGVHASNQTATSTLAISTACWRIDGTDATSDATQRRQLPQAADTVISWLGQTFASLASNPLQFIAGGKSSTSISERLPGGSIYVAEVDGIAHAGGRINIAFETGGQNETTNLASFKAQLVTKWEAIRDLNGGALKVILDPMNKSWTNSDATYQSIRRGHYELTVDRPDLFVGGSHAYDLRNHDTLHLGTSTTDPNNKQAIWNARRGRNLAFHLGETAADYRGPRMVSVQRLSATSVKVVFDLDDFDSLELINSASEFHGGLRFAASTNPASPIWPTAATVDASPSGGTQGVTFTFASNSFPTSVSVWCGYGANPHNPLQNSTINSTTWDTAASTIRGVKSGLPSVGVQPYHGPTVDYITAT